MKKLIVIFLVFITTVIAYKVLYAQFNTSSVDANITAEVSISKSDTAVVVPMGLSHSENYLVLRNTAGVGTDSFYVSIVLAKRRSGSYTPIDTIFNIATTSISSNSVRSRIDVASGKSEVSKLSIPFGYEALVERVNPYDATNLGDVAYFITSEPGQ